MKIKNKSSVSNTKIAIIFFVFLAFVVGISLIFKLISVIGASRFDDSRRFTLSIANGKNIEVMSLSPSSKDVVVFKFNDNTNSADAGRLLEIPIDGFIEQNSLDLNQKIDSLFMSSILSYNKIKTNLTVIDLFKLEMLVRTIPESSINIKKIGDAIGLDLDRMVDHLVSDPLIEKDSQTIKIVNGAGVGGLGNRLARLITNMGGNVIIVATSDSLIKNSVISYIEDKSYTVNRLQKVLGYIVVNEKNNAISDITITIGEDRVGSNPF